MNRGFPGTTKAYLVAEMEATNVQSREKPERKRSSTDFYIYCNGYGETLLIETPDSPVEQGLRVTVSRDPDCHPQRGRVEIRNGTEWVGRIIGGMFAKGPEDILVSGNGSNVSHFRVTE